MINIESSIDYTSSKTSSQQLNYIESMDKDSYLFRKGEYKMKKKDSENSGFPIMEEEKEWK